MCGGGSSSTQKFEPPDYTVGPWKDFLTNAQKLANDPSSIKPYEGQTVADLSPTTQQGLNMITDFATQGTPERAVVGQVTQNVGQGAMNPYAAMQNQYAGTQNAYAGTINPMYGQTSQFTNQSNPYIGDNPYLRSMIGNSNQQIADAYRTGTAAQTDSAFAKGGSYGGSAYEDMTNRNQQQLLGALSANTNNLYSQNYNQSAQLAESGLNRGAGLSESDLSRNSGLAESGLQRGAGLTESALQRGAQLTSEDLNRGAAGWQAGQQNALGAGQLGLGQQGADQSAILAMLQSGQIPQQYQQQLLNAAQQYYQQGQQAPFTLSDYMRSALGAASGTGGTNTTTGPGQSGLLGGLGIGSLLYGMGS